MNKNNPHYSYLNEKLMMEAPQRSYKDYERFFVTTPNKPRFDLSRYENSQQSGFLISPQKNDLTIKLVRNPGMINYPMKSDFKLVYFFDYNKAFLFSEF